MITETATKEELLSELDNTVMQLLDSLQTIEESDFNTVPYEASWTAGQLARHVFKSTSGIAAAIGKNGVIAKRNESEKVPMLRNTFLNFSTKLKAPGFIVPEEKVYDKQESIDELKQAFELFKTNALSTDVNELVEGLPFGDVTKLELIHFIIYHTQRHIHQLEKIRKALEEK